MNSPESNPVAWRWRIKDADGNVSAWEISNSDPKISKMVLHDCEPLYAALAPATGITEERVLNALEIAGLAWEGAVIIRSGKKVPTQAVMNFARALSPSPSVGTPAQTSADRGGEA